MQKYINSVNSIKEDLEYWEDRECERSEFFSQFNIFSENEKNEFISHIEKMLSLLDKYSGSYNIQYKYLNALSYFVKGGYMGYVDILERTK